MLLLLTAVHDVLRVLCNKAGARVEVLGAARSMRQVVALNGSAVLRQQVGTRGSERAGFSSSARHPLPAHLAAAQVKQLLEPAGLPGSIITAAGGCAWVMFGTPGCVPAAVKLAMPPVQVGDAAVAGRRFCPSCLLYQPCYGMPHAVCCMVHGTSCILRGICAGRCCAWCHAAGDTAA